jgi:SulP family sulfate permease
MAEQHHPPERMRGDLIAGVTVATYLIPQVMAHAAVAGVDPVAGLWQCCRRW